MQQIWTTQRIGYDNIMLLISGFKMIYANMLSIYKLFYEEKDIKKPDKTRIIFSDDLILLSKYTDKEYQDILQKLIYKLLKSYNLNSFLLNKNRINKFSKDWSIFFT